ncbi:Panacea domain-containing protein [Herbidospora daliensis]|uniref:Panacea domain-containing protein n=1 Tax=Herbidospora daliensis TaxID=295585 RepID=UPI0007840274|nr:type II toxin-antitoxin system antitoxin SocA domain-containing protein [Herbidospora daliensis]
MASVLDVAEYILTGRGPMTVMKLQKLCYYAYGHHLAWEERALFPERFEAWANGPVSPALYSKHRGRFEVGPGDIQGNPDTLDDGERESVDLVLASYGGFSANQLSQMTHNEAPWVWARSRSSVSSMERSTEELADSDIFEYFDALTASNP